MTKKEVKTREQTATERRAEGNRCFFYYFLNFFGKINLFLDPLVLFSRRVTIFLLTLVFITFFNEK